MKNDASPSDKLNYQLYSDALRLLPWTAPVGQTFLITNFGAGGQTVYVYGKVAAGQAVRTGSYSDNAGVVIVY
jgi:spore coat protein U-like protein